MAKKSCTNRIFYFSKWFCAPKTTKWCKNIKKYEGFMDSKTALQFHIVFSDFNLEGNPMRPCRECPSFILPFSLLFLLLLMKLFGKNTMGKKKINGTVPHQSPHCVSLTQRPIDIRTSVVWTYWLWAIFYLCK